MRNIVRNNKYLRLLSLAVTGLAFLFLPLIALASPQITEVVGLNANGEQVKGTIFPGQPFAINGTGFKVPYYQNGIFLDGNDIELQPVSGTATQLQFKKFPESYSGSIAIFEISNLDGRSSSSAVQVGKASTSTSSNQNPNNNQNNSNTANNPNNSNSNSNSKSNALIQCGNVNVSQGSSTTGSRGDCTLLDLITTAARLINYLVAGAGVIAVLGIVYGGVLMVTSAGDQNRLTTGKNALKNSLIGLVIVLVSYLLVSATLGFLGLSGDEVLKNPTGFVEDNSQGIPQK